MANLDPNYPRWLYHRTLGDTIVKSETEELALGPEWSRKPFTAALEPEQKPPPKPLPEPEEPEEEPEEESEEKPAEPPPEARKTPISKAPPAKKPAAPQTRKIPKRRPAW